MDNLKRNNPFFDDDLIRQATQKVKEMPQDIKEEKEELAVEALGCTYIHIVNSIEEIDNPKITFVPEYLHHFIEDETIRGYADPQLHFYFTPLTMECYFAYTYKHKDPDAPLLESFFFDFFLNGLIMNRKQFENKLAIDQDFKPPGRNIGSYHQGHSEFQCRVVEDQTNPEFSYFNKNIQIFLKFFIETGSYVESDDPMWKFLYMIEVVRVCLTLDRRQKQVCRQCVLLPFLQAT